MIDKFDLVVACVLFKTPDTEVAAMIDQVAAIPLRTLLVLVDNDPGAVPREQGPEAGVLRIWTGSNLGYGRAHNIAIAHTEGLAPLHLIANTDIGFAGEDVARLCRFMDTNPDVGLAAPRVCYPDGRLQHLCRLLPTPADLIGRRFLRWTAWGRRRDADYELKRWPYDRNADIPFLSGCFMLIRRVVLDHVGGFDPRFFLYFEDTDLSRRIHAVGRTCFVADVEIVHLYRTQGSAWRPLGYLVRSAIQYFNKWGWWFDRERTAVNRATLDALNLTDAPR